LILALARRAATIVSRPRATWPVISAERLTPVALLLVYVVPLSLIPAVAWMIGVLRGGYYIVIPGFGENVPMERIGTAGVLIVVASVFSVSVLAAAFWLFSPLYGVRRNIRGAFKVAAYGTTPMWVAGPILLVPALTLFMAAAALHALYLYVSGLEEIMGVSASDGAEFVGIAMVCLIGTSMLFGAALSMWGIL
jgi:Yip1 domain